jgi:hypothetical protein
MVAFLSNPRSIARGVVSITLVIFLSCTGLTARNSRVAAEAPRACKVIHIVVQVSRHDGSTTSPGMPIRVLLRSRDGRYLATYTTKKDGSLTIPGCSPGLEEAASVEARLHIDENQFIGSVMTISHQTDVYCIILANPCYF